MERSIHSYIKDGVSVSVPKEGDERVLNGKTHVWTKKYVDPTTEIFEWVEKKIHDYTQYDYTNIHF